MALKFDMGSSASAYANAYSIKAHEKPFCRSTDCEILTDDRHRYTFSRKKRKFSGDFNGYSVFVRDKEELYNPSGDLIMTVLAITKTTSPPSISSVQNLDGLRDIVLRHIRGNPPPLELFSKKRHTFTLKQKRDKFGVFVYELEVRHRTDNFAYGDAKLYHQAPDSPYFEEVAVQRFKVRLY